MLLNKSSGMGDLNKSKRGGLNAPSLKKGTSPHFNPLIQLQNSEFDVDIEFLTLADLLEIGIDHLEQAVENLEEINFDVFNFSSIMTEHSFSFMIHKIFQKYEFYKIYNISQETLYNFSKEIGLGYFKENPYHNQLHIIDSL